MRARSSVLTLFTAFAATVAAACSVAFPLDKYRADPLDASPDAAPDTGVVIDEASDGSETIVDPCGAYLGGTMVAISGYCIDATEVTHAQYNAFLAAKVTPQSVTGSPSYCSWNADYGAPIAARDDYPVVNVDWCDAYAFCVWAGKHLCGSTEASPLSPDSAASSLSQWYVACANGDAKTKWPYGNTFSSTTCNGDPDHVTSTAPETVGHRVDCHGTSSPFNRVFDMSGNVTEWEDACYESKGPDDPCSLRGGYWGSNPGTDLACDHVTTYPRNLIDDRVGFRCCK